jgi:hypothetical protein
VTVNRSSEELEMRALVTPELRKRYPTARIIHELPLRYSTNRIDLAAVTATEIISVEIKSSKDVIDRLEGQLRGFLPISSRLIVALAPKWNLQLPMLETKVKHGTQYTPQFTETQGIIGRVSSGIEVWTVDTSAKSIDVTHGGAYRASRPWLSEMLDMLHVSELSEIASRHRICVPKRATHESISRDCCDLMTGREIVKSVCWALRNRNAFDRASDPPLGETLAGGERIAPNAEESAA